MIKEPEFKWDEQLGIATCTLQYRDRKFFGMAKCHEEDRDLMSEKTGLTIALKRATIQYLLDTKNNDIVPRLCELKQLQSCIDQSKQYNPKGYESRMIYRKIKGLELELETLRDLIKTEKKQLNDYINDKMKFYEKIRKHREENKDNTK